MRKNKFLLKIVLIVIALFLISNIVLLVTGKANIYEMIFGVHREEKILGESINSGDITDTKSGENIKKENFKFYEAPENKKIKSIMLEGMEEEVNCEYVESSLGYRFQISKDDFLIENHDNKDYFKSKDLPDDLYFTVEFQNINFEKAKEEQKENIISNEEYTVNGNKAFCVEYLDGKLATENVDFKFDSKMKDVIYIQAPEGVYIIEEYYFMEAIEGWVSRVAQMLTLSFEILK